MTADQRRTMALTLNGKGVEVCAARELTQLPRGVLAKHVSHLTTHQHLDAFGATAPPVDVTVRDLSSAWTGTQSQSRIDFVILNTEAVRYSPNPLGLISAWCDQLAPRGVMMIAVPSRARRSAGGRPVTPVEHLFADFKRRRTTACDEHRLANAFEDNPNQFPDPLRVGLVLAYLWALRLYELDAHARRLLGTKNEEYVSSLLEAPVRNLRHHVFSLRSVLSAVDLVNAESSALLAPYDVSLGRSTDEEDMIAFRRFEKASLKTRHGKAHLAECTAMFRRQAASFT
jgi:hypothetical protein